MAGSNQAADLFLKVSSFTRYLLDDVLPSEVYHKQCVNAETFETLVEECEALVISLRTFKQLSKVLQVSDTVSVLSNSIKSDTPSTCYKIDENHALKFTELCQDIIRKVVTIPDLIKFKPYYCKICNLATWYEPVFNRHCTSKRHIDETNQISEALALHKCKICQLLLMAPKSEITNFLSLLGHCLLDKHINDLKENIEKVPKNTKTNNTQRNRSDNMVQAEVHKVSGNSIKANVAETAYLPLKVNQLFQVTEKGTELASQLIEGIPHYCNVCDLMVYSVGKFIDHTSSKEHIAAVNTSTKPINVFKCEKCGFLITGFEKIIDAIMYSNNHRKFDEFMLGIKASKEEAKHSDESVRSECRIENVNTNIGTCETSIEEHLISDMLKKSMASLTEMLRIPTDLKKHAPCYCFPCKKIFSTINDFKQHIMSKKHLSIASAGVNYFFVHYCPICPLSIYGSDSNIRDALDSTEHSNLHKRITYLFRSKGEKGDVENNTSDANTPCSSKTNQSGDTKQNQILKENKSKEKSKASSQSSTKPVSRSVPDKFLTINCKLQCGDFSKSGYCRPCSKGVNIENGWAAHLSNTKHKKALDRLDFENIALPCEYCTLQILGDQIHGNPCMDIHMKLNHPNLKREELHTDRTLLSFHERVIEINSDNFSGSSSTKSKNSEIVESKDIGSFETPAENFQIHTDTNCIKVESDHLSLSQPDASQKSADYSLENNDKNYEVFIKFLNKRKDIFLNEGLKQFGGMCFFCAVTYNDYFEWMLHIKDDCHPNGTDIVEKECQDCNLSFFGDKRIINKFWHLEEHGTLDALFSQ